ncbi:MAG: diguanylate cyclase domain-containing protein [Gammaproteobacteria bacterium]
MLLDRLDQALAEVERHERTLAVLYLDLDRFKLINDSLGHHVGDRLLEAASTRMRGLLRAEDTVARLGGDEFVVVLPDVQSATTRPRWLKRSSRRSPYRSTSPSTGCT